MKHTHRLAVIFTAAAILLALSGCSSVAAYNKTVASRSDSIAVDTSKDGVGGRLTHSVTYR